MNTFNLPDLRGRLPVHQGVDSSGNSYSMGQESGVETVTLTTGQMPNHNHPLEASNQAATSTDPTSLAFAASSNAVYTQPTAPALMNNTSTLTGGNQPHNNLMPYLCITFVISLFGVFPSQT